MDAHRMLRAGQTEADTHRADDRVGTAVLARVRQMFCAMHGHDMLLQFEHDRMFLRCDSCGQESPGWELTETPPTITEQGDARRHALPGSDLMEVRRIA